jgi:hypothetical protein
MGAARTAAGVHKTWGVRARVGKIEGTGRENGLALHEVPQNCSTHYGRCAAFYVLLVGAEYLPSPLAFPEKRQDSSKKGIRHTTRVPPRPPLLLPITQALCGMHGVQKTGEPTRIFHPPQSLHPGLTSKPPLLRTRRRPYITAGHRRHNRARSTAK